MTRRSGGGFFGPIQFGKKFGRVLVKGAKTTLAAETEQSIAVEGVHGLVELIAGDKAGLQRVRGCQSLGFGFFPRRLGDEGLEGGLARFLCVLGVKVDGGQGGQQKQREGEKFQRRRSPPLEEKAEAGSPPRSS